MKSMRPTKPLRPLLPLLLLLAFAALPALAQQGRITLDFEYPGVEVFEGDSISVGLVLQNKGSDDQSVNVQVAEKPAGWTTAIKSSGLIVTGAFLPAGQSKILSFEASPPAEARAGRYQFRVEAQAAGERLGQTFTAVVRSRRELARGTAGLGLATAYPILRGSSDIWYEFSVELENKLEEDNVFDLNARGPEGWEVNFKPAYENRYISSFQLRAKKSGKLTVEVKPPAGAKAGEYPVAVRVSSGAAFAEITLTVVLTGTYDLAVESVSGVLSLAAQQGKPAQLGISIKNLGTAPQNHIGLFSFQPENWLVDFIPDAVDGLQPGETRQVEVLVTPDRKALVGDYSLELKANGEKVSKPIEFRVTVKASSVFGWLGIIIIVLVIGGLALLFRWLGRR
jgi:uncharacterized membrane protein